MNKQVLVTGGAGFVGRRLCRELEGHGWTVLAGVRKTAGVALALQHGRLVKIGNLEDQAHWPELLAGCRAVVHLAGRVHVMHDQAVAPLDQYLRTNTTATRNLAEAAAAAGVQRFLFVSTIKASGEGTPAPGENGGWPEDREPAPEGPYAVSKARAEEELREVCRRTGMEFVIVRPPLVYGPGVKGNFLTLLRLVAKGMPLPLASLKNRRSLLGVGNLADFICHGLEHPGAASQIFQVADAEPLATPELIRAIAGSLGRSARLLPFPPVLLRWAALLTGRRSFWDRLGGSLVVETGKAEALVHWQPPHSLEEELAATVAWYRADSPEAG